MKDLLSAELLAAVCHDLRGPLGALGTWVHVLGSGQADADTRAQALAAMARDVRAQGELIEQLSELAALSGGTATASATRIELLPFVKAVVGATGAAGFRLDAQEPGPSAFADADRLRRLVELLITSTVKLAPDGILELRVASAAPWAEVVVEAAGSPRRLGIALAGALAELQQGSLVETLTEGHVALRLRLPQPGLNPGTPGVPF